MEKMMQQSYLFKNKNHVVNLNNARLSGKLCDVTVKVNDKEFRAHKIILAANLKYFESMFSNSFQESELDVVTMQDVDETNFEALITFAYTGEILLTDGNALDLLQAANYLNEDSIERACVSFLEKHLRTEDVCRAYRFADAVGCAPLKNTSRQIILSNFGDCSPTREFLDLDFDSLKDILSDASLDFVEPRQMVFEGVVRWLLDDAKSRRACVNDLLSIIDITKLKTSYLLEYFCKRIKDRRDIVEDIMSFYYSKSEQNQHNVTDDLKQKLMITSNGGTKLVVQYYDFAKKKWDEPREVTDHPGKGIGPGTISNDKYYYTVYEESQKMHLHAFDSATEKNNALLYENRLLRHSANCACTKYLYFCGGLTKGNAPSDQVLRYDPLANTLATLAPLGTNRSGAPAVFYQGCVHVLGGWDGVGQTNLVEKYEPATKKWTAFPPMNWARYFCAAAVLDGKLYACGGLRTANNVEVYDPWKKSWQMAASMNQGRRDFVLVAREGKLLAIGGDREGTVEVYDPVKDVWQVDLELSAGLRVEYPRGGLVSSNCDN